MSLAAKLAVQVNQKKFNQGNPQRLAAWRNERQYNNNRQQPRNYQGDPIMEAKSLAMTAPQCQRFPNPGTRIVRGAGGQAMRCGPKANGCKSGCSGSEQQVACGAACANPAAAMSVAIGRRDVGAAALARLTQDARTQQARLLKNPCSPHGREWGRQVSEGERIAQLRSEAACTAGISGTALSESQNCASALLQGRLCNDLAGNVGAVNSGQRQHARECGALDILPPEPGYVQNQTDKVKLCKRRLPTVKRMNPLSGSELIQMTADCERRAQQIVWNNDFWCGGAVQTGSGSGSGVAASRQTTVTGSPEATVHIVGALDAATVTLLRNALIAAGGAGTITTIQIGTDVTSIDDTVFQNETTLTSLAFKDEANSQCATIGDSAFQGCTSLTSMTLPSGLASIGVSAFEGASLTSIISIPAHVTSIGDRAFYSARPTTLTFETGGSGLTIGDNAFTFAQLSGQSLTIPAHVTAIGRSAFFSATPTTLTFETGGSGLTIDTGAFDSAVLSGQSLTIPAHVTSIGASAFFSATPTALTFETGGSGLTIGAAAFDSAVLSGASLTIPAHVTAIGTGAFQDAIPTTVTFSANASTSLTTSAGVQPFPSATSLSSALGLLSNFGASSGGYTTIDRTSDVVFS